MTAANTPPARRVRIARFGLIVSDLSRLEDFYCGAFGFERAGAAGADPSLAAALGLADHRVRTVTLGLGQQVVELTAVDPPGAAYPIGSTAHDPWFQHLAIVVPDMEAAYDRLAGHAAAAISRGGPQTLPPSTGSVTAYKFRDPDGHPLELLAFPPRSSAKWQNAAGHRVGGGALGIDHSAIVVAQTERSVAFYGTLGFEVAHRSLNSGAEQARLDATDGVEVAVTALHTGDASAAGLELLEYRSITDRPNPIASSARDIVATRVMLETDDLDAITATIPNHCIEHIDGSALLRDPDGHLILCTSARHPLAS